MLMAVNYRTLFHLAHEEQSKYLTAEDAEDAEGRKGFEICCLKTEIASLSSNLCVLCG
jgi:hypothetical protein